MDGQRNAVSCTKVLRTFLKATDDERNAVTSTKVLRTFQIETDGQRYAVSRMKVLRTFRKCEGWSAERRKMHKGATNFS